MGQVGYNVRPDTNITDSTFHALVGDGTHGANDIQGFKCQACATRLALEPLNAIHTALGRLPDAF